VTDGPTERDRLCSLVADYCVEHGVADLTLRSVGAAVGTNNRMLLYYFGSKEELIIAALREAIGRFAQLEGMFQAMSEPSQPLQPRLIAAWKAISAESNIPYLRLFFEVFGLAAQHPERFGQFLENVGREWTDRLAKILRDEGVPMAEARPMARHLVAVWRGLQFDLIASGDRANIHRSYALVATELAQRVQAFASTRTPA
jgi:AcrR family transcriptional regulator